MKILLFTHISDIDGLNNVILAKEAFDMVDYILCESQEIDKKIEENKSILNQYDFIYVTDLCPKPSTLDFIRDNDLRNKFKVFDHHKDALPDNNYDFVTLKVSNEKGACCGTSLFYEYLINNKYLQSNNTLNKLVELTRRYDTWEWKKYNDIEACNLMYLFNAVGVKEYLNRITERIKEEEFSLSDEDINILTKWKSEFDNKIKSIVDKMKYMNVLGYKAGVIETVYEYRNDITEFVREKEYGVDFLAMIFKEKDSVSYRSIKDIDVSEIAKHYGGHGHRAAASSPITKEEKNNINEYFNR